MRISSGGGLDVSGFYPKWVSLRKKRRPRALIFAPISADI
jgi:hypothetical protein